MKAKLIDKNKVVYRCPNCNTEWRGTLSEVDLRKHLTVFDVPVRCPQCGKVFETFLAEQITLSGFYDQSTIDFINSGYSWEYWSAMRDEDGDTSAFEEKDIYWKEHPENSEQGKTGSVNDYVKKFPTVGEGTMTPLRFHTESIKSGQWWKSLPRQTSSEPDWDQLFPNYTPRMDRRKVAGDAFDDPRNLALKRVMWFLRRNRFKVTASETTDRDDRDLLETIFNRILDSQLKVLETRKNFYYKMDAYGFHSFDADQCAKELEQFAIRFTQDLVEKGHSKNQFDQEAVSIVNQIYIPKTPPSATPTRIDTKAHDVYRESFYGQMEASAGGDQRKILQATQNFINDLRKSRRFSDDRNPDIKDPHQNWSAPSTSSPEDRGKCLDVSGLQGLVLAFINSYLEIVDNKNQNQNQNSDFREAPANPIEYEKFCQDILNRLGWAVDLTKVTGDFGADLVAVNPKNGNVIVVQCKLYRGTVSISAVQEVVGALRYYCAQKAFVVSTGEFTASAKALAKANDVTLCHHSQLPELF